MFRARAAVFTTRMPDALATRSMSTSTGDLERAVTPARDRGADGPRPLWSAGENSFVSVKPGPGSKVGAALCPRAGP